MFFNKLYIMEQLNLYVVDVGDENMNSMISHTLNYYAIKAINNKIRFYRFNIVVIICNAIIPIFAQISIHSSVLVTILATIGTIFSSLLFLTSTKKSWHEYRKHLEILKQEIVLFNSGIGIYKDIRIEDKRCLFLERYTSIVAQELIFWTEKNSKQFIQTNEEK